MFCPVVSGPGQVFSWVVCYLGCVYLDRVLSGVCLPGRVYLGVCDLVSFLPATTEATTAVGVSGCTWYGDDSPHLTGSGREQARLVKTVKVQVPSAKGGPGSDRRLPPGRLAFSTGSG